MKKLSLVILITLFCNTLHAQNDSIDVKQDVVIYSFFYNMVPDRFNFPLIGFVNLAMGNHQGLQVGFVNTNFKNFSGAQIGFVNTVMQEVTGLQVGLVNTTFSEKTGYQIGLVNTVKKIMKGSQIGLVNYADTVTGVPIGIVSIVKRGGYKAVEISTNEYYPINLSFKIGVPKLYSFIQFGYNPDFDRNFASGFGFGSLALIGKNFYFNPEISLLNSINSKNYSHRFLAFAGNFRYNLNSRFQVAAGPSLVWEHSGQSGKLFDPVYSIINNKIDDKNRLVIGARAALSFDF